MNTVATLAAEQVSIRTAIAEFESAIKDWEAEKRRLNAVHGTRLRVVEAELRQRGAALRTAIASREAAKRELVRLSVEEESCRATRGKAFRHLAELEVMPPQAPERARTGELQQEIEALTGQLAALDKQIQGAAEEAQEWALVVAEKEEAEAQQQRAVAAERQRYRESLQSVTGVLEEFSGQLERHRQALDGLEQEMQRSAHAQHSTAGTPPSPMLPPPIPLRVQQPRPIHAPAARRRILPALTSHAQRLARTVRLPQRGLRLAISAVLVVFVGAISWAFGLPVFGSRQGEMAVRVVASENSEAVAGAKVVLFFTGGPVAQHTDVHGASTLLLDRARGRRGRLTVEKDGFRVHDQDVRLDEDVLIEVRLEPPDPQQADILVRAVDGATGEPVRHAEILLLAGSDRFQELTDTHGLGRFTLDFLESKLYAEMSVSSFGYAVEHNRVTLLPDKVQDISLDRATAQLRVKELDLDTALLANFRDAEENRLRPGTRASGHARQGTASRYAFAGQRNTPVVFQVQRTAGGLGYGVDILGPQNRLITEHGPFHHGAHAIPFTPREDGEYGVRVRGMEHGGDYVIALSQVNDPSHPRDTTVRLGFGHSARGMLAAGSWNDFTFDGAADTPLVFKLQRSMGELGYTLSFYDDQGNQLARHGGFRGGWQNVPFIPPRTGTYRARLQGTEAHGGYTLTLSQPAPAVVVPQVVTAAPLEAPPEPPLTPEKENPFGWLNVMRSAGGPPGQAPAPGFKRRHP